MRRAVSAVSALAMGLICLVVTPQPARGAVVTVGRLRGAAGEIVRPIVEAAESAVTIDVVTTSTLDAAFFGSIDVFVYANAAGAFVHTMGSTGRTNLVNFVNDGGTAYLGVDRRGDGAAVASAFGFTLADRIVQTSSATVTDLASPIAAGPFQPADEFTAIDHGRFVGAAPADGAFIGSAAYGSLLGYRTVGAGRVYIFADEVPLTALDASHPRMFQNVLVGAGADVAPARPPVVATNSFLVPEKVHATSWLRVYGTLDTGAAPTDLAGPARLTVGDVVIDIPGLDVSKRGTRFRYSGRDFSLRIDPDRGGSSRARFSLIGRRVLADAVAFDAEGNGRLTIGLDVDTVAARCDVGISRDPARPRRTRLLGARAAPGLRVITASGVVRRGRADSISLNVGFATDGVPAAAPSDLRIQIGPSVDVTIRAWEFYVTDDAFVFTGGRGGLSHVSIRRGGETITIVGANLDLGPLAIGANPFTVLIEKPGDARSVSFLLARKRRALRY